MSQEKKVAPTKKSASKAKGQAKGEAKAWVSKPRKATFIKDKEKGQVIYRPVNKRAHKWAKKVGKRTKLTIADMKAIKATKKVKLYAYEGAVLKAVRV